MKIPLFFWHSLIYHTVDDYRIQWKAVAHYFCTRRYRKSGKFHHWKFSSIKILTHQIFIPGIWQKLFDKIGELHINISCVHIAVGSYFHQYSQWQNNYFWWRNFQYNTCTLPRVLDKYITQVVHVCVHAYVCACLCVIHAFLFS